MRRSHLVGGSSLGSHGKLGHQRPRAAGVLMKCGFELLQDFLPLGSISGGDEFGAKCFDPIF